MLFPHKKLRKTTLSPGSIVNLKYDFDLQVYILCSLYDKKTKIFNVNETSTVGDLRNFVRSNYVEISWNIKVEGKFVYLNQDDNILLSDLFVDSESVIRISPSDGIKGGVAKKVNIGQCKSPRPQKHQAVKRSSRKSSQTPSTEPDLYNDAVKGEDIDAMIMEKNFPALSSTHNAPTFKLAGSFKLDRNEMELVTPCTQEDSSFINDLETDVSDYQFDGFDFCDDDETFENDVVSCGSKSADIAHPSSGRKGFYYI